MKKEGIFYYLKSPWNYLDIIPPSLFLVFAVLAVIGFFDNPDPTGYIFIN
jgi:hypothetical protein